MKKLLTITSALIFMNISLNASPKITSQTTPPQEQQTTGIKNSTEFSPTTDVKDNGCFNLVAGVKNDNTKYIKDFYYTVLLDIWFNNEEMKKFPRPTTDSVDRTLLKLCNFSMSKNLSFNFVVYQKALEHKMSHAKYFEIDERVYKKFFK